MPSRRLIELALLRLALLFGFFCALVEFPDRPPFPALVVDSNILRMKVP